MSETGEGASTPRPDVAEHTRSLRWTLIAAVAIVLLALGATIIIADDQPSSSSDQTVALATSTSTSSAAADQSSQTGTEADNTSSSKVEPSPPPDTAGTGSEPETPAPCLGDQLTDRQRLGQLLMVGVDPSSTSHAQRLVESEHIGGIFIGGNDTTLIASGTLTELVGPAGIEPFVAVDDEGGRVQRIEALVGDIPSAREFAASSGPEDLRTLASERARQLAGYGINVNFAPVVDISEQDDREVIGDRSYSRDPGRAAEFARAFAEGMKSGGVIPVYKHFPGHGRATGDSHLGSSTSPPLDQLDDDLLPYRTLLADDTETAVMIGHLTVPGLTESDPATISDAAINGLLRNDVGFDGLVFTDELGAMQAISDRFNADEAARRAISAGADVALFAHPTDAVKLLDAMEADLASGSLPRDAVDQAVSRVLRAKGYDC